LVGRTSHPCNPSGIACVVISSRRPHTRFSPDWSSDVCSSDLCPGCACAYPARPGMMPTSARPPVTTAAAARTVNYVEIPARYRKELCLHTAVPEPPAVAVQLTGREPLFLVMNSRSGKQDSEATRQAIRTACAEAGRRCELLVVERGADLASAARKAVTLAREQGGIVVAVGGDGTLNAV